MKFASSKQRAFARTGRSREMASRPRLLAVFLAFTGWLLAAPAHAIVVTNPSFEAPALAPGDFEYDPAVPGWTLSAGAGIASVGGPWFDGNSPDGSQAAFFQGFIVFGGAISQILSGFTVGTSYNVTFWIADRDGFAPDPIQVLLGGTLLGTYTNLSTDFVQETTATMVAIASSMILRFTDPGPFDGDRDSAIDAVSVNQAAAIPEPATLLVLGSGLVALASRRLRRGNQSAGGARLSAGRRVSPKCINEAGALSGRAAC